MCSAYVWPRSVQGQGHNLKFKHCMTVFCVRSLTFEPLVGFTNNCTNVKYDETMCSAQVWPRLVQGQGHNLRLNIVWLYFVSALYLLNTLWDLQITLHKCEVWWDDVQCLGLTKVGSRSRSQFKIKHCMTVFSVRSISFEPLVRFTNNFAQMSSMIRRCAVLMFDQGRVKVRIKIKHSMTVFHVGSKSFEPLVGFTNYSAQMSRMMRSCAVPMFDQCLFKVKVTV